MDAVEFAAMEAAYEARRYEEADEARARSWTVAARPGAEPVEVAVAELRPGDYMTADGTRWVRVVELQGPSSSVKRRVRHPRCAYGQVSVLFEIPEPVTVSGETRYWIERHLDGSVVVDAAAR